MYGMLNEKMTTQGHMYYVSTFKENPILPNMFIFIHQLIHKTFFHTIRIAFFRMINIRIS